LVVNRATLCLLNAERTARHLRRLIADGRLGSIALDHSRDMVRRHYFAHLGPGGENWLARMGRLYHGRQRWQVGENLAWGDGVEGTSRSIVTAWMHSRDHRANILTAAFGRIGIGVATGVPHEAGLPGATYTTGFGT